MRSLYLTLALLLVCSAGVLAQSAAAKPSPAPTPPADTDVVKISTNLIQLDVTVTDSKGRIVTDLKPEEIEVYENGQKQKLSGFSFISSVRPVAEKPREKTKADPTALPPPPSATLRPEQIRRTIALVVDDLSLSFESAVYTRRALQRFVDEQMQEGDLVAIIRTGAGVGALQQFTSDKRVLYAAIDKVRWNPFGNGGISAFAPIQSPLTPDSDDSEDTSSSDTGSTLTPDQQIANFRSTTFATGTLGALRYIVGGMSELPGRKSVMLFSDGFKLYEEDEDGNRSYEVIQAFMKQLVDAANRASVTFYTLDSRGLVYTGPTAADDIRHPTATTMADTMSQRSEQLWDTQDGLQYLARETGGFAVVNNNDLTGGVRRALEDQSYYLVAYEPDTDTFDAQKRKFNEISVKVLRPGLTARYRSGFFNVASADRPASSIPTNLSPVDQLQRALMSPFSVNGVNLRLNSLFGSSDKKTSYIRSLLHVDASDLTFTDEPNGDKKAKFDILAMSFGDQGQVTDQFGKSFSMVIPPENFKRILEKGFVYSFVFPVKKPGAYQYRVAMRDSVSGKIGSATQFIQVPDLKKRLATSSLVIESFGAEEWKRAAGTKSQPPRTDSLTDTARRIVQAGSVLRYGYEVYNAKLDQAKQPHLTVRIRVFRDGKVILDGQPRPFPLRGQTNMQVLKDVGAIDIGSKAAGDYILQVIVTDELGKKKEQNTSQYIQFEVVK